MTSSIFSFSRHSRKESGFTIVELLIVVVVIAILAAITIVSYNGITNRANAATAQNNAKQASTKIQTSAIDNSELFPANKADFLTKTGLVEQNGISYQYIASSDQKTYCVTVTTKNRSYYTGSATPQVTEGACPGHGANGEAAITNYVTKPIGGVGAPWGRYNTSGTPASTESTGTITGLPNGVTNAYRYQVETDSLGGPYINIRSGYMATKDMRFSVYLRSASAISIDLNVEQYNASSSGTRGATVSGGSVTLSPNIWQRVSMTVPYNASYPYYVATMYTSTAVPATTVLFASAAMLTEGTTLYNYADGNSPNWVWNNGTSNASFSTGPPQ